MADEDLDVYADFRDSEDVDAILGEHKADFAQLYHPLDDLCGVG